MTENFKNVHIFDGILKGIYNPKKEYSDEDKILEFTKLHSKLINPAAVEMLERIMNDGKNYDPINDIDATDLLMDICTSKYDQFLLEEQLIDMLNLGPCPQGRTVRLWQIYCTLKN